MNCLRASVAGLRFTGKDFVAGARIIFQSTGTLSVALGRTAMKGRKHHEQVRSLDRTDHAGGVGCRLAVRDSMKALLFLLVSGFIVACLTFWLLPEAWGDDWRVNFAALAGAFWLWRAHEFVRDDSPPYADEDYCPRKSRSPFRD